VLKKIILNFIERDMYHVINMVFQYVGDDLRNAELVSREWKQVVTTGSYYEKHLKKKVSE